MYVGLPTMLSCCAGTEEAVAALHQSTANVFFRHTVTRLLSALASMSHSSSINIHTDKAPANHPHCAAD